MHQNGQDVPEMYSYLLAVLDELTEVADASATHRELSVGRDRDRDRGIDRDRDRDRVRVSSRSRSRSRDRDRDRDRDRGRHALGRPR